MLVEATLTHTFWTTKSKPHDRDMENMVLWIGFTFSGGAPILTTISRSVSGARE
jgi:hypothetical protein